MGKPTDGFPLEPDRAAMQQMGSMVLDMVSDHIAQLTDGPMADLDEPAALKAQTAQPPPAGPGNLGTLLALIEQSAAKGLQIAGPGQLGYFGGGGLYTSALADFLGSALNRYVPMAVGAPALARIELSVVRWLCRLFELPPEAMGILTTGGSMANFSAVVTARAAKLGQELQSGTFYVSEYAHHSLRKAALLAGLPDDALRTVPCTADLRFDVDALRQAIARDRARGRRPFLIVGTAGTTETGTVDPLPKLARLAKEEDLWLHVDAAYGGFFQLTERGRRPLDGIHHADSITVDPHKGLFLPFGCGALVVRDGRQLRAAHHIGATYLDDVERYDGLPNFAEYGPELTRDFRGLRMWLPLHLHGTDAFRSALDEKLDLARHAAAVLAASDGIEVPWAPELAVVLFRYAGSDADNQRSLERVNASNRVFLARSQVQGRTTLRLSVLGHRTHFDRVDEALQLILGARGATRAA